MHDLILFYKIRNERERERSIDIMKKIEKKKQI